MWMNHRFARVGQRRGAAVRGPRELRGPLPVRIRTLCRSPDRPRGCDPETFRDRPAGAAHPERDGVLAAATGRSCTPIPRAATSRPPDNVRVYMWASSQHFADPNARRPARGICRHYANVVQTSMLFRAMLDALDAWATHGVEPPASRIPRRGDGTLVDYEAWKAQFPGIPGVMVPSGANALPLYDFGPGLRAGAAHQGAPGDRGCKRLRGPRPRGGRRRQRRRRSAGADGRDAARDLCGLESARPRVRPRRDAPVHRQLPPVPRTPTPRRR